MDVKEARGLMYQLLSIFYSGASVKHSKQPHTVKSKLPLVTLTTVSVKRPLNPTQKVIDGITVSYYPTKMGLQIDLYTKGNPVEQRSGFLAPAENTALSDLLEFANFAVSDYAVNWCHRHDVSITLTGEAHDMSELINDVSYQFRATLELTMNFTQKAVGYTAMLDPASIRNGSTIEPIFTPSASGSTNEELAKESLGYFTSAEITDKEE